MAFLEKKPGFMAAGDQKAEKPQEKNAIKIKKFY